VLRSSLGIVFCVDVGIGVASDLMSISLGTRNMVLRLANLSDLDIEKWMFHIKNVKGQDTCGEPRSVSIPPEVRHVILQYRLLREKWLKSHSADSKALFFGITKDFGHLSSNSFRKIKSKIELIVDENFEFRDCRRGFGQNYLDKGLGVESVLVLMGHSSTKTTEGYYCHKSQVSAIEEARGVW